MWERFGVQGVGGAAAGEKELAMGLNEALANIWHDQRRHDEAVVIYEADMKFRRRVLPENHPDIGVT